MMVHTKCLLILPISVSAPVGYDNILQFLIVQIINKLKCSTTFSLLKLNYNNTFLIKSMSFFYN